MKKHLAVVLAALLAGASVNTMMVSSVFAKEASAEAEKSDKADKGDEKKATKGKKGGKKGSAKGKKPAKKKKDAE
jgi:hypothetical protein